jgi:hypothetical protein
MPYVKIMFSVMFCMCVCDLTVVFCMCVCDLAVMFCMCSVTWYQHPNLWTFHKSTEGHLYQNLMSYSNFQSQWSIIMQMLPPLHPKLTIVPQSSLQNCQGYLILFIQCLVLTINHTYLHMQKTELKVIHKSLQTLVEFWLPGEMLGILCTALWGTQFPISLLACKYNKYYTNPTYKMPFTKYGTQ